MFGSLGMPELVFILLLALLVFGPKRLPQVGRTLGRGLREFRRATNELKRTVETEISASEMEPVRPTAVASPPSPVEAALQVAATTESGTEPEPESESESESEPDSETGSGDTEQARPADGGADTGTPVEPAGEE